jgi:hypothetical protein
VLIPQKVQQPVNEKKINLLIQREAAGGRIPRGAFNRNDDITEDVRIDGTTISFSK